MQSRTGSGSYTRLVSTPTTVTITATQKVDDQSFHHRIIFQPHSLDFLLVWVILLLVYLLSNQKQKKGLDLQQ
jgi:hypothetical protein